MNRVPTWMDESTAKLIKRAERSVSIGTIPVDVVDALIDALIAGHERWRYRSNEHVKLVEQLEKRISHLGGGFDRRGLDGDQPGIVVRQGIHTVIEDAT